MGAELQNPERGVRAERGLVFALCAGAVLLYALRGGTYDLVLRGEAAVVVWWTVALGFATGLLPRARPARILALPAAGLGGLVVWTALSHGWTESDERTSAELARTVHHAGVLVLAVSVLGRRTWDAAVGGVLAGMAAVCVVAVASRLEPSWFPSARDLTDAFPSNRLSHPLNYWNAIAAWGAVTVALGLAVSTHARNPLARAGALAAVPVAVAMAYMTYSRGGVLGIALAVLLALVLARHRLTTLIHLVPAAAGSALAIATIRDEDAIAQATGGAGAGRVLLALGAAVAMCAAVAALTRTGRLDERLRLPRRRGRAAVAVGAVLAVVAGAAVAPGAVGQVWDEFRGEAAEGTRSDDPAARLTSFQGGRYEHYVSAWNAFEAEPLTGIGAGSFEFWWNRDADQDGFIRDAHSLYLEFLAELGLVGALLLLALLAGLLASMALALRRRLDGPRRGAWAAALAGVLVTLFHASFEWIWESTANMVAMLLLAGAGVAALSADREGAPRVPWRVGATAVAVLALLVQLPPLVSTSKVRESQEAVERGDEAAAAAAVADAVDTQPWAATPYVQRALLSERAGRLDAARRDVLRAQRREPTNWRHPLLHARVLAEQGRARAALAAFRQAQALRPRSGRLRP